MKDATRLYCAARHLLLTPANGHDNVQEHADVLLERGA
jgi:hypothetical protein